MPPGTRSVLDICCPFVCNCPRIRDVRRRAGNSTQGAGIQNRWNTFGLSCWSAEAFEALFLPCPWLPGGKRWHLAGGGLPEPTPYELWSALYHGSSLLAEKNRSFLAGICRGREWSQPWFNLDRSRWWEDCVLSWSFPLNSYGVEGSAINRHSILSTLVQFCLQLPI